MFINESKDESLLERYSARYQPGSGINFGEYCKAEFMRMGLESGVTLSWSNLTYTVTQKVQKGKGTMIDNFKNLISCNGETENYDLISNASGFIKPGMMTLLLGPPGGGKTTLLEVLAGRKKVNSKNRLYGDISINGRPWTPDFNRVAGYVSQDDYHIPLMTVRETFLFSSRLRNHPWVSEEKIQERVDVVLDVLGLSHVADTVVGGELLRGVSGGERKRVSIGVELVTCPSVLFMDEPTSGLDSSAAYDVMKALRLVADNGIPVVVSLLQPSQELYNLFDHVIVMNNRSCAYFGPTNTVLEHFENCGFTCPPHKNVAEFLLDICTPDGVQYHNSNRNLEQTLVEFYESSPAYESVCKKLQEGVIPPDPKRTILPSTRVFNSNVGKQINLCTRRSFSIFLRNKRAIIARMLRSIIVGLLIGTLFWNLDTDQIGGSNRISLVFFCITFTAMGAVASIPQVVEERRIFYHQRAAHFYRTIAAFISSLVMDVPLSFIEGIIFTTMVFWMCHMWNLVLGWHIIIQYLLFVFILLFTNLASKQLCRFCAAATPTLGFASALAPAILCIWLVFAGFLIPRTSIPWWYAPVNILSAFRYTLESLSINVLRNLTLTCSDDQLVPPKPCPERFMVNSTCYQSCPSKTGYQLLKQYGMLTETEYIYIDFAIIILFYSGLCVMTYLSLEYIQWFTAKGIKADNNAKPKNQWNNSRIDDDVELFNPSGSINSGGKAPIYTSDEISNESAGGASLAFTNLHYSVNLVSGPIAKLGGKANWKPLLRNVMGFAPAGRMIALMGATGAGKTTLLDVLAQRKTGGNMEGNIIVNGNFKDKYYNRLVGYVEQTNVFLPTLTVKETLQYSAFMRLNPNIPREEILKRVEEVIDTLLLRHVANTLVGSPDAGGLSMELRKKLSIAVELVSEPAIFFLDEPTTGLDSQAAASVMETARIVANTGVPVICTIHQPSADIFYLFDWLLLLKPGGQTIYFGPLGEKGATVIDYFERHGLQCEQGKNPADFVLACSGAGIGNHDEDDPNVGFNIPDDFDCFETWSNSNESKTLEQQMNSIQADAEQKQSNSGISPTGFTNEYAVSLPRQIILSMKRSFMNKYRQPTVVRSYFLMYLVMALLLGTLFFQLDLGQAGARNRVSLIYFCIVFSALGAISAIPGIILQRAVYYREKPSFLRPFAYFIAQVTAEVPLVLLSLLTFSVILYVLVGFRFTPFYKPIFFLVTNTMATFTCTAFAMMVASGVATTEVANTIVGVSSSIFSLFAGFIIPKDSIPRYWRWAHYLSFFSYPLESMSINELCDPDLQFDCTSDPDAQVPVLVGIPPNTTYELYCPISTGSSFLQVHFNMETTIQWAVLDDVILGLFMTTFIFLTYAGIKWVNHLKR